MRFFIRNKSRYDPSVAFADDVITVNVHHAQEITKIKEEARKAGRGCKITALYLAQRDGTYRDLADDRTINYYDLQEDTILETTSNPFWVAALYANLRRREQEAALRPDDARFCRQVQQTFCHRYMAIGLLFNGTGEDDQQPATFNEIDQLHQYCVTKGKKPAHMSRFTLDEVQEMRDDYLENYQHNPDPVGSFVYSLSVRLGYVQEDDDPRDPGDPFRPQNGDLHIRADHGRFPPIRRAVGRPDHDAEGKPGAAWGGREDDNGGCGRGVAAAARGGGGIDRGVGMGRGRHLGEGGGEGGRGGGGRPREGGRGRGGGGGRGRGRGGGGARRGAVGRTCDDCDVAAADHYCAECTPPLCLCDTCWRSLHRGATRRHHQMQDLADAPRQTSYVPQAYKAPFAMLVAFHRASQERPQKLSLTAEELKVRAQPLTDTDLETAKPKGKPFSGFDSLENALIKNEIVLKEAARTPKYSLLESGQGLASKCSSFDYAVQTLLRQANVPIVPIPTVRPVFRNRQVCLLVDEEEPQKERFVRVARQRGLAVRTRKLPTGDFCWVLLPPGVNADTAPDMPDQELVLPYLVERKTWDDFFGSVRGTRFASQVTRMKNSGIKNLFYLVEGSPKDIYGRPGPEVEAFLKEKLNVLLLEDGFFVNTTPSWIKTVEWLCNLTNLAVSHLQQAATNATKWMSFSEFTRAALSKNPARRPTPVKTENPVVWTASEFARNVRRHHCGEGELTRLTRALDDNPFVLLVQGLIAYGSNYQSLMKKALADYLRTPGQTAEDCVRHHMEQATEQLISINVFQYYLLYLQVYTGIRIYKTELPQETEDFLSKYQDTNEIGATKHEDGAHYTDGNQHLVGYDVATGDAEVVINKRDDVLFANDSQEEETMLNRALQESLSADDTFGNKDDGTTHEVEGFEPFDFGPPDEYADDMEDDVNGVSSVPGSKESSRLDSMSEEEQLALVLRISANEKCISHYATRMDSLISSPPSTATSSNSQSSSLSKRSCSVLETSHGDNLKRASRTSASSSGVTPPKRPPNTTVSSPHRTLSDSGAVRPPTSTITSPHRTSSDSGAVRSPSIASPGTSRDSTYATPSHLTTPSGTVIFPKDMPSGTLNNSGSSPSSAFSRTTELTSNSVGKADENLSCVDRIVKSEFIPEHGVMESELYEERKREEEEHAVIGNDNSSNPVKKLKPDDSHLDPKDIGENQESISPCEDIELQMALEESKRIYEEEQSMKSSEEHKVDEVDEIRKVMEMSMSECSVKVETGITCEYNDAKCNGTTAYSSQKVTGVDDSSNSAVQSRKVVGKNRIECIEGVSPTNEVTARGSDVDDPKAFDEDVELKRALELSRQQSDRMNSLENTPTKAESLVGGKVCDSWSEGSPAGDRSSYRLTTSKGDRTSTSDTLSYPSTFCKGDRISTSEVIFLDSQDDITDIVYPATSNYGDTPAETHNNCSKTQYGKERSSFVDEEVIPSILIDSQDYDDDDYHDGDDYEAALKLQHELNNKAGPSREVYISPSSSAISKEPSGNNDYELALRLQKSLNDDRHVGDSVDGNNKCGSGAKSPPTSLTSSSLRGITENEDYDIALRLQESLNKGHSCTNSNDRNNSEAKFCGPSPHEENDDFEIAMRLQESLNSEDHSSKSNSTGSGSPIKSLTSSSVQLDSYREEQKQKYAYAKRGTKGKEKLPPGLSFRQRAEAIAKGKAPLLAAVSPTVRTDDRKAEKRRYSGISESAGVREVHGGATPSKRPAPRASASTPTSSHSDTRGSHSNARTSSAIVFTGSRDSPGHPTTTGSRPSTAAHSLSHPSGGAMVFHGSRDIPHSQSDASMRSCDPRGSETRRHLDKESSGGALLFPGSSAGSRPSSSSGPTRPTSPVFVRNSDDTVTCSSAAKHEPTTCPAAPKHEPATAMYAGPKCSECGEYGHRKGTKKCPYYYTEEAQRKREAQAQKRREKKEEEERQIQSRVDALAAERLQMEEDSVRIREQLERFNRRYGNLPKIMDDAMSCIKKRRRK